MLILKNIYQRQNHIHVNTQFYNNIKLKVYFDEL